MKRLRWIEVLVFVAMLVAGYEVASAVQRTRTPPPAPPSTAQPRQQPPQRQQPPSTAQPRQQPPPRPRPESRPDTAVRRRAPESPAHQRVYPVPGVPQHGTMSRVFVPHRHYPRPYFVFQPRYWIGYGLYVGYPLAYPLTFGYPAYIYDAGEIVTLPAAPAIALYGGLSFDVMPDDATVIVDGREVGVVCDFSATEQPLTLRPGRHRVELRAPGLTPLAFDVTIVAGQVVPFSGVLQPR